MPLSHPPALRVSAPAGAVPRTGWEVLPCLQKTGASAAPASLLPVLRHFAFARFSLTKSQLTSLSKNVCTQTGRRFW